MTPSDLRQWAFQNSKPDQWWLSLDSVTLETPVSVDEIENRLKAKKYASVQILHPSQMDIEHPPWVSLSIPRPMAKPKPDETLGTILVVLPAIGLLPVLCILPQIRQFGLLTAIPFACLLYFLLILMVSATAILIGVEANKLEFGKTPGEIGPIGWSVFSLALWFVAYPLYLFRRARYGAKNLLWWGLVMVLLVFIVQGFFLFTINKQTSEIGRYQQSLRESRRLYNSGY